MEMTPEHRSHIWAKVGLSVVGIVLVWLTYSYIMRAEEASEAMIKGPRTTLGWRMKQGRANMKAFIVKHAKKIPAKAK